MSVSEDELIIQYTVVFLYLIPRGLRLIKPLLLRGRESVVALGGEYRDGGAAVRQKGAEQLEERRRREHTEQVETDISSDKKTSRQPLLPSPAVAVDENERIERTAALYDDGATLAAGRDSLPSLRIVTYMAGWSDVQYVAKELCTVGHQKDAMWPVYLYHFR